VHGCGQYESIARQGRWGSSFLSGHRTSASYWPLPALQNVSKRLSPSTACTEVGSFLGEVPYDPARDRFGTLLQHLECGIFGRTAVRRQDEGALPPCWRSGGHGAASEG